MTEEKKNKNPFIKIANTAKKTNPFNNLKSNKLPKPNKGFGNTNVIRKTGRGS